MAVHIYPSYPPPINDIKVNEHWSKAFNVNGRLSGLQVAEYSTSYSINVGTCITNGVVVYSDNIQFIPIGTAPVQPYYFYCYFGFAETANAAVFGFSRTLLPGYALLATKVNDSWNYSDRIYFENLKDKIEDHSANSVIHITNNQYDGFANANAPSVSNIFAKESDTTGYLPVMNDELRLLPYSIVAGHSLDSLLPIDLESTIIYDSVTSNNSAFVAGGLKELFSITNTTAKITDDAYIDNTYGNIIEGSDSNVYTHLGRLERSDNTSVAGPKGGFAHKVKIVSGHGPANFTWHWPSDKNISSESNHVYLNVKIPNDINTAYLKLSIYDGVSSETTRINASNLTADQFNSVLVSVSSLNKTTIKTINLEIGYEDLAESDYFYIGNLASTSVVETVALTDIVDKIQITRVSSLKTECFEEVDPLVDISVDNGLTYLENIQKNDYVNISSLTSPSNYKLKIRFQLLTSGGNFTQSLQQWPEARKNYMMFKDSQSDSMVLLGGLNGSGSVTSSRIYNRKTDSFYAGPINSQLTLSDAGHTNLSRYLDVNGGIVGTTAQFLHYLIGWQNNTIISRTGFVTGSSRHGCASYGDYRLIRFQGWDRIGQATTQEYSFMADTWTALVDSGNKGRTCGDIIDKYLYAAAGESTGSTGIRYDINTKSWQNLTLGGFAYYSTCVKLKTRAIIYESESNSVQNRYNFDHDTQIETAILAPLTGAATGKAAVYNDDTVSFGPWEKDGTYYTTHNLYVPYKSPRLSGFAVKYIT